MPGRSRLGTLALIAVVAAAVAFPIYYFKVLGPQRRAADDRSSVRAFSDAWTSVRTCVLGEAPGETLEERVLLREVRVGPTSGGCHRPLRELEAALTTSTGEVALDRVWNRTGRATRTFLTRLRTFGSELHPAEKKRSSLAESIHELDTLTDELRAEVGLDARDRATPPTVPALPDGTVVRDVAGQPAQLIWWMSETDAGTIRRPALQSVGDALALTVARADGVEVLVLDGPDPITHTPIPEGAATASGGGWAAVVDERGALAVTPTGEDGLPRMQEARRIAQPEPGTVLQPLYAMGSDARRAVVFGRRPVEEGSARGRVEVLASPDAGQTWAPAWRQQPADTPPLVHGSWIRPRAYLSFVREGAIRWLPITDDTLTAGLEPQHLVDGSSPRYRLCTGKTELWILTPRGIWRAPQDGTEPPTPTDWSLPEGLGRTACTDQGLATITPKQRESEVRGCHVRRGCGPAWTITTGGPAALHVRRSERLAAANTVGGFVVVWELEEGRFGRLAPIAIFRGEGMDVVALSEWDDVLHVLVADTDSGHMRLVPIDD